MCLYNYSSKSIEYISYNMDKNNLTDMLSPSLQPHASVVCIRQAALVHVYYSS